MGLKLLPTFCVIFQFLTMFNTIVGAGAVGAASRYGSGTDQKMRLRIRNTALMFSLLRSVLRSRSRAILVERDP
jgi:hypothetical protein